MDNKSSICLISVGGTFLPYGNILNESKKFGNLNIEYLSQYLLDNGLANQIFFFSNKDLNSLIVKTASIYRIVIFFVDLLNYQKIIEISSSLKRENASIATILFGKIIDIMHKNIVSTYPYIDFCCLGSPNESVKYLIDNKLDAKKCASNANISSKISYDDKKPNLQFNPDIFPNIEYYKNKQLDFNKYKTYPLTSKSQVCFGSCTFCWANKGRYVYKSNLHIMKEIEQILSVGINDFVFVDNDFFDIYNESRENELLDLCGQIARLKRKITFSIFARPNTINSVSLVLLKALKKAGLHCVFIGIDAGNEFDKVLYNKKSTIEDDIKAINRLKDCFIFYRIGFIGINPYSSVRTLEENFKTLRLLKSSNIYHYLGLKLMLFPGTPLYMKTLSDKLIDDPKAISNVYGYEYINKDVEKIISFLDDTKAKIEKNKCFVPFISLKREYERAIIINSKIKKYGKYVLDYEKDELRDINSFFEIIYLKKDLELASKKQKHFVKRILDRAKNNKAIIEELREKTYGIFNK